jgi:hypothetical protein
MARSILSLNTRGAAVKELHDSLVKAGFPIPKHELDEQVFGVATHGAVCKLQGKYHLPSSGKVDEATKAALARAIAEAGVGQHWVEGQILFKNGLPAEDIIVRLYSKGLGGAETRLGESKTDEKGFYAISYDPGCMESKFDLRVVDAQGKDVTLSSIRIGASKKEVLNLIVPPNFHPFDDKYPNSNRSSNQTPSKH